MFSPCFHFLHCLLYLLCQSSLVEIPLMTVCSNLHLPCDLSHFWISCFCNLLLWSGLCFSALKLTLVLFLSPAACVWVCKLFHHHQYVWRGLLLIVRVWVAPLTKCGWETWGLLHEGWDGVGNGEEGICGIDCVAIVTDYLLLFMNDASRMLMNSESGSKEQDCRHMWVNWAFERRAEELQHPGGTPRYTWGIIFLIYTPSTQDSRGRRLG